MSMTYVQLWQAIQDYSETTESLFVSNIPVFVMEAEERIYNSVQLPSLRKNVTGTLSAGNQYLSLPNDYLSTYSIAVIDSTGSYNYLLNKDVNLIRQAYPSPLNQGMPYFYALFGSQYTNINEMSLLLGPTPDQNYSVEMHYYYYPPTIVAGVINGWNITNAGTLYIPGTYPDIPLTGGTGSGAIANIVVGTSGTITGVTVTNGGSLYIVGDTLSANTNSIGGTGSGLTINVNSVSNSSGTSWLGENFDPVLFYGAMREAMIFQKQEADVIKNYEDKYQEALKQLQRLGDGLERGDAYRNGQTKLPYNKL
jgi:hypothetical protein